MYRTLKALFFAIILVPTAAHAQFSREDIRIFCFNLKGLEQGVERITNRQQVYNNDERTWHSRNGCAIVPNRDFTTNREIARQQGVFNPDQIGGFIGWIVTDRWLVPVEHVAFLDRAGGKMYRPADILSRDRFTLPEKCLTDFRVTTGGVTIYGHQFDWRGQRWCRQPILQTN